MEAIDYPARLLRLYLSEGDSQDSTLAELQAWAAEDDRVTISKHDTGIPRQWHTTRPERMRTLALTGNVCWDLIAADGWGDYALMLESDLLYKPDLLRRLVERRPAEADIFLPMIWINVGGGLRFYDVWAYRMAGQMFPQVGPEWYAVNRPEEPYEIDSGGSVVLFKMDLIRAGARLSHTDAVMGMCNQARAMGARVFVDPETHVLHPQVAGVL